MREKLARAYKVLTGGEPDPRWAEWQLAEGILNNWSVPKLGESLARQIILLVGVHVQFPDLDLTRRIVGHAENLATELWPELPEEPHMAQLEYLEGGNYGG